MTVPDMPVRRCNCPAVPMVAVYRGVESFRVETLVYVVAVRMLGVRYHCHSTTVTEATAACQAGCPAATVNALLVPCHCLLPTALQDSLTAERQLLHVSRRYGPSKWGAVVGQAVTEP